MPGSESFALIYFIYGLAFFSMGFAIILEVGREAGTRLHIALRPLAAFGLLHGVHEWMEMFLVLELLPLQDVGGLFWEGARLGLLAFSFLSLTAFGAWLLAPTEERRRAAYLVPLMQAAIWGFGLLALRGRFVPQVDLWNAADVWSRYVLGVPSALLASLGLIVQQREFRRAGLAQFGRHSLWAAVAFAWYGLIGQVFTRTSLLAPSTIINQELFFNVFGFPVQLLRAAAAVVAAVFVMLFLRSFEVATQQQIQELQDERLSEARRRETLRSELLRRVVSAQEAERQRIARELHDESGQSLTAIGLGLRAISRGLERDPARARAHLQDLETMVDRSLTELRRMISDLRPSQLDDLGLSAALRWYASSLQQRANIRVAVKVHGEPHELGSALNIALYRIAQEALTNVVRHAGQCNVLLCLEFADQAVTLTVEDDGSGFDVRKIQTPERPAWGLLGIEERASLLSGRFALESAPGHGTRVSVTIPYPAREILGKVETTDEIVAG